MQSSTAGRAAMMRLSRSLKPELVEVQTQEMLLLVVLHGVEPVDMPLC